MTMINKPNLPRGNVSLAVCGTNEEVAEALEKHGAAVVRAGPCAALPPPIAGHADLLCLHLGGKQVLTADEGLARSLRTHGLEAISTERPPAGEYPGDVSLNCLITGELVFTRKASAAPEIITYIGQSGRRLIDVKQGYARCSVALVDERSAITADRGLADAMETAGLEALRISPGGIRLEGYDAGFIGGCCGKLSSGLMLFCGKLEAHPNGAQIIGFLDRHNVRAVCIGEHELCDFGGFVPLLE